MSTDAPEILIRHERQLAEHGARLDNHDAVIAQLADSTDRAVKEISNFKDVVANAAITITKTIIATGIGGAVLLVLERLAG